MIALFRLYASLASPEISSTHVLHVTRSSWNTNRKGELKSTWTHNLIIWIPTQNTLTPLNAYSWNLAAPRYSETYQTITCLWT